MVDETDKALISLGVLVGAAIVSAIIAKIVDICYDRASISDDASDISEHTRNLIRARLTVMKFRNKKPSLRPKTPIETETEKQENAVKVFRIWSAKSKMRTKSIIDVERATAGETETKLELEDLGDDNRSGVKPLEGQSKGETSKHGEDQTVELINETLPVAPVIIETNKSTIRPKSAMKKPNTATTTNTAGATTVLGKDSTRPKSGVKRVTIAEPESPKTDSVHSRGESTSKDSDSKSTLKPDNASVKSASSQRSENKTGPEIKTPGEGPPSLGDSGSKTEHKEDDQISVASSLPQAWNDGQGSKSSGSSGKTLSGSKPKKKSLATGKEGWRETYVLYRGGSEDLLVPFDTKKKKSKRKGKKGK